MDSKLISLSKSYVLDDSMSQGTETINYLFTLLKDVIVKSFELKKRKIPERIHYVVIEEANIILNSKLKDHLSAFAKEIGYLSTGNPIINIRVNNASASWQPNFRSSDIFRFGLRLITQPVRWIETIGTNLLVQKVDEKLSQRVEETTLIELGGEIAIERCFFDQTRS